MSFQPSFRLPDSPDSYEYREIAAAIEHGSPEVSAADFVLWCENDFWFFNKFCLSFGRYLVDDPNHKYFEKRPWIDCPWVFDRCRDIQLDEPETPKLRLWHRGSFKSALVTINHTLWDNIIHSDETGSKVNTLILTYKLEDTGEGFVYGIKREAETNPRLSGHWPNVFFADPKAREGSPEWTANSLRFKQAGTPKEPSVLCAGLLSMPTSGHYERIKIDDAVVQHTVTNQLQIEQTYRAMRRTSPLRKGRTFFFYVGTNWAVGDPYVLGAKDGLFEVDHQDCYGPRELPPKDRKEPVLYSAEWYASQRKLMGPYDFSSQMRNNPIAESEQNLDEGWLKTYYRDPYEERLNGNVYILIDPAGGKANAITKGKGSSDYSTILVLKLGPDGNKYVLDLYRDRFALEEFQELVFWLTGDPSAKWKPGWAQWGRGDWRAPGAQPLRVYEEIKGADRDVQHFKMAMEARSFRFEMKEMPSDAMSKEGRIKGWSDEVRLGKWWFPAKVGHSPKGDNRDTMAIWLEEEYRRWTPEGGALHDDGLDIMAYASRYALPGAKPLLGDLLRFPQGSGAQEAEMAILAGISAGPLGVLRGGKGSKTLGRSSWAA